ncbi:retinol dehydrogenase 13 [Aethina tumida]|uniref:retinol dehydrogenase 13 n=1 Tax=Aethina tumida TaxID=116153 RepID=UPI0021489103|nr:retinol dehydrogenase 13 [Aethina tumida]
MFASVALAVLLALIGFKIFSVLTCIWCRCNVCLSGKTAIITGGNSGIGYQIATSLASRGCRIIIADKMDGTEAKNKMIAETHNPNIEYKYMDLASFKSVREFAADIIAKEERLDILINNAGIAATNMVLTEDDLQRTMQVNYFGPFLLTCLLTELLKKSAPSRIIFVASLASIIANLTTDNLNPNSDYIRKGKINNEIYANSKLGDILISMGFAKRLKGTGVTSNVFCPGGVNSQIYNSAKDDQGFRISVYALALLSWFYGKSPQAGAQTAIHLACSNELENVTGKFFKECFPIPVLHPKVYNQKYCDEIWTETERLVKLKESEKISV